MTRSGCAAATAAVGRGGGGGGGLGYYASLIQGQIQAALKRNDKTKYARFTTSVSLRIGPGGRPQDIQLAGTGDAEIDALLRQIVASVSIDAPDGLPKPVSVRIRADRS